MMVFDAQRWPNYVIKLHMLTQGVQNNKFVCQLCPSAADHVHRNHNISLSYTTNGQRFSLRLTMKELFFAEQKPIYSGMTSLTLGQLYNWPNGSEGKLKVSLNWLHKCWTGDIKVTNQSTVTPFASFIDQTIYTPLRRCLDPCYLADSLKPYIPDRTLIPSTYQLLLEPTTRRMAYGALEHFKVARHRFGCHL